MRSAIYIASECRLEIKNILYKLWNQFYLCIRNDKKVTLNEKIKFYISHLASDVLVNQMVLALVVKDDVNLLCAWATNVRT